MSAPRRRSRTPWLGVLPVVAGALAAPCAARAQEPCPARSGAEAEAGWAAYRAGDMTEAERRFEGAMGICPDDTYAQTGLGYVRLRAGRTADAAALWQRVVAVDEGNVDALVGLGLVAWRDGDVTTAAARFRRVRELDPGHPTAAEYLARIEGRSTGDTTSVDAADRAWSAGDSEAALRLYTERLDRDPSDRVATIRVALMHGWRGDYASGIQLLDGWLARAPDDLDAHMAHARLRAWSGDVAGATEEVRGVLAVEPDHSGALSALSSFSAWARDVRRPVIGYARDPNGIAPADEVVREPSPATAGRDSRTAYETILAGDPDDVDARLGLAATLASAGAYDAALAQYDTVLARHPGDSRALIARSRALAWAGRLGAAEEAARRAVAVDGLDAGAWAELGRALYWQGRSGAAKQALDRAASLAPTDPEIRDRQRSVDLLLAPVARPTFVRESDSDGTTSLRSSIGVGWHPVPRLEVWGEGWEKRLDQDLLTAGSLRRIARGLSTRLAVEASAGWTLSAGVAGSVTDGVGTPDLVSGSAAVASPRWRALSGGLDVSSEAVLVTVSGADRGVRATEASLTARWLPAAGWRLDGSLGVGVWDGTESNGRRNGSVALSRRWSEVSIGAAFRGFSFEKNLNDGYFDPDFYGIVELTTYWLRRPGPWTILIEAAPGIQQVGRDGGRSGTVRANARIAYRWGGAREVSLSYRYSSAGLVRRTEGGSRYRYDALVVGLNLVR